MNLKVLNQRLEMPPEDGAAQPAAAAPAAPAAAPTLEAPASPGSATPATAEALESHINELLSDDAEHNGATSPAAPAVAEPKSHVPPAPSAPVAPTSPAAQPAVQPAPAAPVATPPQPAAPAAQPPAQPTEPAPAAATPAQPAVPPEQTPEARRAVEQQRREVFTQQLEKQYEVPEAQRAEINVNPAALLPKLAARLHVEVLEATTQGLAAVIPQIVEQVIERRNSTMEAERAFYSAWPQLKRDNPQHHQTVQNLLGTIVAMNPRISRQDAIKQAGAAALVALGIPYDQSPPPPTSPPVFQAAAPGAGGHVVPGSTPDTNPFSKLSREFEEEI